MREFSSTYRLQIRPPMDLAAARRLVPYLRELGITHLYASPLLKARHGSAHGYDVVDPTIIDPELGGEQALGELVSALRQHDMGLLLDIVPNHMAFHESNPYLWDVMKHGPASAFASWFDIDWGRTDDHGKPARLVVPVLATIADEELAAGDLRIVPDGDEGLCVAYHDRRFPIDPATRPPTPDASGGRDTAIPTPDVAALLERQAYRLVPWREGRRAINYRRFFDIDELIALRVEDDAVFRATHTKILELVARGWLDGLRVDHVDGLADPSAYLLALRRHVDELLPSGQRAKFGIWVEKILARDEVLVGHWPVEGTTGYEFARDLEELFVLPAGAQRLQEAWDRATTPGTAERFEEVGQECKRAALRGGLGTDLSRLAARLASTDPAGESAVSKDDIAAALVETIAVLPIYRTYLGGRPEASDARQAEEDRARLSRALRDARSAGRAAPAALDRLEAILLGPGQQEAIVAFQQLSGPAAARGIEDTALYRHAALLSRNDVGAEPHLPIDDAVSRLHDHNAQHRARWPRRLLSLSTHDSKRSADVRARLDVLSERSESWLAATQEMANDAAVVRAGLDARMQFFAWQALLGIWPAQPPAGAEFVELRERMRTHLQKAAREAKLHTSWIDVDADYEARLDRFVDAVFDGAAAAVLTRVAAGIAPAAQTNSLARTLLHLTSPGIPDIYQGEEMLRYSSVDPDNRRPVDFAARAAALHRLADAADPDKLRLVHTVLQQRRRHPTLYAEGSYAALAAAGPASRHVFVFARQHGDDLAVVIVPRLHSQLADWQGTVLELPATLQDRDLVSPLSGTRVKTAATLSVASALAAWPVELFVPLSAAER